MNEERTELCYYQVTTREAAIYYRCGEVGDILRKTRFGISPITSARSLPDCRVEVQAVIDEERKQEILDGIIQGKLTLDGKEVFIEDNAFLTLEEAEAHAIQLIEVEISRLRKKQEEFRATRLGRG